MKKKIKLADLTVEQVNRITLSASKKKNVPLIKSKQVNMRIDSVRLDRLKIIAQQTGEKFTTVMSRLLIEDIDRLWSVLKKG